VYGAFVAGVVLTLLGATAAPALAVDDPTRPDAQVTHGPSCRPGGLVVEVVAGTVPYSVRLATTRTPAGEDEALLAPGETVVLRSGDVAWGETIDGRLEFAAADGSGTTYVDELEEYSFTRPTFEDCEAVTAPLPSAPSSPPVPSEAPPGTTDDAPAAPDAGTSAPPPAGSAAPASAAGPGGTGAGSPVSAGDTVTLQASGFRPGELVTIVLHGSADVLGTATAGPDGTVSAEIRIPHRTTSGATTLELVGDESAVVAPVGLRVAGAGSPVADDGIGGLVPLTAAAAALVAALAGLVSVAGSQRWPARSRRPLRHA
jgi:hypothetical protein